jgi:iron(III) transport system permease protein
MGQDKSVATPQSDTVWSEPRRLRRYPATILRTWAGRAHFGSRQVVLIATVVLLLILVVFPLFELLRRSFIADGHVSLANYATVLQDRANYAPFLNTLLLGALTVVCSLLIAVPAAWLIARSDVAAKQLVETLFVVPFIIPPFVGAISWIQLASPRVGYLNKLWIAIAGGGSGPFNIYSLAGTVFVMTLHAYPFVYLTVRAGLERMNSS